MESIGLEGAVGQSVKNTNVNVDAESWNRLEPGICGKISEKLPHMERLRLHVVCKDWNWSALKRVELEPYFVIILQERLNGLVVYDVVSKSLSFEQLPFKIHGSNNKPNLAAFAVEGPIFSNKLKGAESDVGWLLLRSIHEYSRDPGKDLSYQMMWRRLLEKYNKKPSTWSRTS